MTVALVTWIIGHMVQSTDLVTNDNKQVFSKSITLYLYYVTLIILGCYDTIIYIIISINLNNAQDQY